MKRKIVSTIGTNGSECYLHYFATAPRSLSTVKETKEMLKVFMEKFPEPEYKISVQYCPESGYYYPTAYDFLNSNE